MLTGPDVQAIIDDVAEKLFALEAASAPSDELTALHESLAAAQVAAIEHFELPESAARSGGSKGPKEPPE